MLRFVKYAILVVLALLLLTLSLANLDSVTLRLLPADVAAFFGFDYTMSLPLFIVVLGGVVAGLLIGFIWEWLREHRFRVEAARARAEADRLEARLGEARRTPKGEADDILALLDDGAKSR